MKILVVDDEQLVRWFLERALGKWGHTAVAVASCREAEEALDNNGFEAVFTDLRMPEENGATLLRRLGEKTGPKPRVVVCSAYLTQEMAEEFRKQGHFVLRKPFKLEELETVLRELNG